jgi:hypothetical protein
MPNFHKSSTKVLKRAKNLFPRNSVGSTVSQNAELHAEKSVGKVAKKSHEKVIIQNF